MVYKRLGNTGLQVSRICLGCMSYGKVKTGAATRLDPQRRRKPPYIKSALDHGINFFDTAKRLLRRRERSRARPRRSRFHAPRRGSHRYQSLGCHGARLQRPRPLPQSHPLGARQKPGVSRHRLRRRRDSLVPACSRPPDPPLAGRAPNRLRQDGRLCQDPVLQDRRPRQACSRSRKRDCSRAQPSTLPNCPRMVAP